MPTLIDTNILVYARGVDGDPVRQRQAIQALQSHHGTGALSVQVLAEFSSVLLHKGISIDVIHEDVMSLEKTWTIVAPEHDTVSLALRAVKTHRMSFWDAMLWATARQHDLTTILSEDGPTGATVGGIVYVSPFAPDK